MSKLTKKDRIKVLEWQVKTLIQSMTNIEEWSDYADDMLTELNHALPDPEYDAKCEAAVAGVEASLDRHRERLGLNKPQLKQLDQSVFDGLDEKWRFAAIDKCGEVWYSTHRTQPSSSGTHLSSEPNADSMQARDYCDASNWQNSLIERDTTKELTGSELVRAMLERGDKCVMCMVANNEANMFLATRPVVVHGCTDSGFISVSGCYSFAVAVNNQGEPLTAAEAGF